MGHMWSQSVTCHLAEVTFLSAVSTCTYRPSVYVNNNNNNHDNIYGAVVMAQSHCESSPGYFDECILNAG